MYKFILGLVAGVALCHYADERKKKKAVDDVKTAAQSAVDAVKSVVEKPATGTEAQS